MSEQPTLSVSDGRELTLDLAGFNLFFATDGGLVPSGWSPDGNRTGDVATAEGADGKPEPLATVSGTGSLALKGGSYNQDVAPYVADSYASSSPPTLTATAPFSVVPPQRPSTTPRPSFTMEARPFTMVTPAQPEQQRPLPLAPPWRS